MQNKLDIGTYGNSKCAHDLVTILNGYNENKQYYNRRVGSIFQNYFKGVKDICLTECYTRNLLDMWKSKYLDVININNKTLSENIKTRMCNIVVAKYKDTIELLNKV